MQGTFHLLDELGDIVEGEARFQRPEIPRLYFERPALAGALPQGKAPTQRLIDYVPERTTGAARFCFELHCHIVIKGESRAHALMLGMRHHDVNLWSAHALSLLARVLGWRLRECVARMSVSDMRERRARISLRSSGLRPSPSPR